VKKAKALVVGNGAHKETDVGPLISPEAKERAVRLITEGIHQARSSAALLGTTLPVLLCTLDKNYALLLLPYPLLASTFVNTYMSVSAQFAILLLLSICCLPT